ncbi:SDR family NAD(P)-dependent oxidoreductase [Motiliproteus sp. MSK22-1]|uniref:SDR family NAD(P)-dependent oxidoreductase n=1 Tax=Motiliproteus sp. MSK22-1 TaxID=1897630 RepID=UPI000976414C|nr:SDR family NAD(P)-dependent oxidoreductase [Motiliproteus sp. MSK22-1]OMH35332.1 dehydrogenase [Motiliproteus sp. MSK22-1]
MSFEQLYDLSGKAAVVTGGTRGIGRAIAETLLEQGAEVHLFDVSDQKPEELKPFIYHQVDISNSDAVNQAVAQLPANTTILVNNAGITRDRSLAKMADEEWQSVININLGGAFHMIRAMAPRMREAGHGRIVNITSINGIRGKFGQANYSAAKAGLIGLTKTTARELGSKGVTVNAIAPGMVMTEMAKQLPPEYIDKAQSEALISELALPEDIANAVLFLVSDAARMITGEVIRVDAGQYL